MNERELQQYFKSPAIRAKIGLPRHDAGESFALARELLYKMGQAKSVLYAPMKGRLVVPISHEIPNGAETWGYDVYDRVGSAQTTSSYHGRGPRVDVKVSEVTGRITGIRDSYGWSFQEMRAAAMTRRPLSTMRAQAAASAIEEQIDRNLAFGVSGSGFTGMLNNADVSATGITGFLGDWVASSRTAMECMHDLDLMHTAIFTGSKEAEAGEGANMKVVLPTTCFDYFAKLRVDPVNPRTALEVFLATSTWCKGVSSWSYAETAGSGNVTRAMVYTQDPGKVEGHISQEFEQFAPEVVGAELVVECHARIAGVHFYYPGSARYQDSI